MDNMFGFLVFLYLIESLNVCTNHNILFSKYSLNLYYIKYNLIIFMCNYENVYIYI